MSSLKDILNNHRDGQIPPEQLQAYLEGRLSAAEQHEIELLLAEDSLQSDALEGLQSLTPEEAKRSVTALNSSLHNYLQQRRRRRQKQLPGSYWGWVAVLLILLLVIAAFLLIRIS